MYFPSSQPWIPDEPLSQYLERRGVSRRDFLAFCAQMTAALGLSELMTPRVAAALAVTSALQSHGLSQWYGFLRARACRPVEV
jgi:hypothetical protein